MRFVLCAVVLLFLFKACAFAYSEDYNFEIPVPQPDYNNEITKLNISGDNIYSTLNFPYNNFAYTYTYTATMKAYDAVNNLKQWAQYSVPSYMTNVTSVTYNTFSLPAIPNQYMQKLSTPVIKNTDIFSKKDDLFITNSQNYKRYNWVAPPKITDLSEQK